MKVLVVGHPRSGTGYAAECFQRTADWDVGHEVVGVDGISSWMWAAPSYYTPWGSPRGDTPLPPTVLHILRDPAKCIASVVGVEGNSETWRRNWVKIPTECGAIERAVWSLYWWTHLIRRQVQPTHVAQTEYLERVVSEITGEERLGCTSYVNKRPHPRLTADEIKATPWILPETAQMWDRIQADYAAASREADLK